MKTVFHSKDQNYSETAYYEEEGDSDDQETSSFNELNSCDVPKLLEIYDTAHEKNKTIIKAIIMERFELVGYDKFRFLTDMLEDIIEEIREEIDQLKNHNHEAIYGSFTSKAKY